LSEWRALVAPRVDGRWLREQRQARRWDVAELARRLAGAAEDSRGDLPDHECLVRYIRRWESGSGMSERYRLLYAKVLGLPGDLRTSSENAPDSGAGGPYAPEMVTAIGRALHAGEPDPGQARDIEAVQRDVMRAWRLRQSARYAELGELLAGLLLETVAHLGTSSNADMPAAVGAAVHAHNTASSLLKRLGAFEMAAIAADRAFRLAQQSEDSLLTGAATLRLANVFLAAGRDAEAMETAAQGTDAVPLCAGARPEAVATFGALLLTAAVAAAQMNEAARAWEFLGQAKSAAGSLASEQAGLCAVFGPVNLAIHGVQVATELGDFREALRRAERVEVAKLPASLVERRTTLLIDIARSQTGQGDHSAAGDTLLEAERLAPLEVRYNGAARGLLAGLLARSRVSVELRELATRVGVAA
jgi:tetratricopeptide (TPR) repeat protein